MIQFVIDIDDTILFCEKNYKNPTPDEMEIKHINKLYEKGHTIIIHTGRNWDKYELTVNQLKQFNVKYHELVMGKPQGIYIDKDSFKFIQEAIIENEIEL